MIMGTRTTGTGLMMDSAALARLMSWLSPSYPVGAYSYSHGIEWAVEAGDITSRAGLEDWIGVLLNSGSGRNDAILFAHAYRAVGAKDGPGLAEVAELAGAFAACSERQLETTAQGMAFLEVTSAAWPCSPIDMLNTASDGPVAYPVAVAVAAAGHDIDIEPALIAYLHGFAANLVSAGVRLVPLGQTDGQRAIAALTPVIEQVATAGLQSELSDLGSSAVRADLASMFHETQQTRLFRS